MAVQIEEDIVGAPSREPQQGRSRASFERMIRAAEDLLAERGNDDFTLMEVSKRGKVSIGSIYCRFDSKDELVRAVQTRVLADIEQEQSALVEEIAEEANGLQHLVLLLVDGVAESLRRFAPVMRPIMARSVGDDVIASAGKRSYAIVADKVAGALLDHRGEIAHPDPERAVTSAYRVLYAALARYLGFGSAVTASGEGDWSELKEDLGWMFAAFLTTPHERAAA